MLLHGWRIKSEPSAVCCSEHRVAPIQQNVTITNCCNMYAGGSKIHHVHFPAWHCVVFPPLIELDNEQSRGFTCYTRRYRGKEKTIMWLLLCNEYVWNCQQGEWVGQRGWWGLINWWPYSIVYVKCECNVQVAYGSRLCSYPSLHSIPSPSFANLVRCTRTTLSGATCV